MFKVVEFEDASLGIIRKEWLTPRKRQCLWPPHKLIAKFNKCLMTQAVPDENWAVHVIKRTFYETDDISKARQKCKKAESESELASTDIEVETTEKWQRKRKVRPPNIDSDDYEESDDECQIKYPIPPKSIKPPPPPVHTRTCSSPSFLEDFNVDSPISSYNPTNEETTPMTSRSKLNQKTFREKINSSLDSPISSHNPTPTTAETTPTTLRSKYPQKSVLEKINSSLDAIADYLGHMKTEVEDLKQTQNDILLKISSHTTAAQATLEIGIPLKSVEDLTNIQNWLSEQEHKEQLINNLSFIGGKGTGSITRRILERVFTDSLAIQCNWTGKNNKFSLKNLELIKVIIAAVRRNKVAELATESEITNIITSWFRFARDRNGGRENRRRSRSN